MDAPNAPNPANPNAQDQNVDAAQGPANQAQDPAVQNPAQGPANKNEIQVPAVQVPVQVPAAQIPVQVPADQVPAQGHAQVVQNVPVQSLQQLAPAGVVMPVPQIIYQNWKGKKPEFSGKPEEDAESHLLSTRDWMGST